MTIDVTVYLKVQFYHIHIIIDLLNDEYTRHILVNRQSMPTIVHHGGYLISPIFIFVLLLFLFQLLF